MVNRYISHLYWDAWSLSLSSTSLVSGHSLSILSLIFVTHLPEWPTGKKWRASVDVIVLWSPDVKYIYIQKDFCNLNVTRFILLYIKVLFTITIMGQHLVFASNGTFADGIVNKIKTERKKPEMRRTICCYNLTKIIWMAIDKKN